jgi:hypothetical protein
MEPLPPNGATLVPCAPRGTPVPDLADAGARFDTPLDDGFDELVALKYVYLPAGAGRYHAALASSLVRDPRTATFVSDEPALVRFGPNAVRRARELCSDRTACSRAILASRGDARATFYARAAAMRRVVLRCGAECFVRPAELPSARPLAVLGTERFGLFRRLAEHLDDVAHWCVCAALLGADGVPTTDRLLHCIGTALVRRAGGQLLLHTARAAAERLAPWLRPLSDARGLRCTLVWLAATGARLATGTEADWIAEVTRTGAHECVGWVLRDAPAWMRACADVALSVVELWRALHRRPLPEESVRALAARSGLAAHAVDASIDRILDAAVANPEEVKRKIPRKILRLVLASAARLRHYADLREAMLAALREMQLDFAAQVLACLEARGHDPK